jgi:hypothetical protein
MLDIMNHLRLFLGEFTLVVTPLLFFAAIVAVFLFCAVTPPLFVGICILGFLFCCIIKSCTTLALNVVAVERYFGACPELKHRLRGYWQV